MDQRAGIVREQAQVAREGSRGGAVPLYVTIVALAVIAVAKLAANIATCSFFIFIFVLPTIANGKFWLDVQATTQSFTRWF